MRRWRVLVTVAVLWVALAIVGLQAQPGQQGRERRLVVASYNIHHGSGNDECTTPPAEPGQPPNPDCSLDLGRIAQVIRALNAEVIGLQEVDRFWARSGDVDQPRALARMLHMHPCYGANLDHPADSHANVPHQYGTAILSRWPIHGCENTLLPRTDPGNEQRGLLEARITVRGVRLHFANTHLQHDSVDDRIVQAQTIADRIATVEEPVILVGDLNAIPTEESLPPLFGLLTDAWVVGGDGDGFTIPARPGVLPDRRIDYVLVSPSVSVHAAIVAITDETRLASDHYPVVAGIAVPR
ncbi:MAG: metal-dependent hydrolase [Luteitalea sp.]|nr:metal-dependent hydrolase [Luteitalea sp.]